MDLIAVSLSHHTADLALREQVAVTASDVPAALARLVAPGDVAEALLLSTCNRTELYVRPAPGRPLDAATLLDRVRGPVARSGDVLRHVRTRAGWEALGHLFRVTCGLESLVLGEHEIARQVSDAYALAQRAGTVGPLLHRVVPRALQVGKRVRTQTGLGKGVTSVAGAAASLVGRVFRDPSQVRITTVGAGRTVRAALETLRPRAGGGLVVVNRSVERARALAGDFGGTPAALDQVHDAIGRADVVVAATGAAEPVVRAAPLVRAVRSRRGRPLLFLDLGVPRDVHPDVALLDEVFLYDLDHLRDAAGIARAGRAQHVPQAERLVEEAVAGFRRRRARNLADPEVRRVLDALLELRRDVVAGERGLSDTERDAADRVTGKFVDRLLRRLAPRIRDRDAAAAALLACFERDGARPPADV